MAENETSFDTTVMSNLKKQEMIDDLKKFKSSQFNKKVRPILNKLSEMVKIVARFQKDILSARDNFESPEDIVTRFAPNIPKIKKILTILTDYKKTLDSKKNTETTENIIKKDIVEDSIKYAKECIRRLTKTNSEADLLAAKKIKADKAAKKIKAAMEKAATEKAAEEFKKQENRKNAMESTGNVLNKVCHVKIEN